MRLEYNMELKYSFKECRDIINLNNWHKPPFPYYCIWRVDYNNAYVGAPMGGVIFKETVTRLQGYK